MAVATSADAAKKKALQAALAAAKKKAPTPKNGKGVPVRETVYNSKFGPRPMPNTPKPKALSSVDKVKSVAGKAAKVIRKVPGGGAALKAGKFVVGGKVGMGLTAASIVAAPLFNKMNQDAKKGTVVKGAVGQTRGNTTGFKPASGTPKGARSVPSNNVAPTPKKVATTKYRVETGDTLSGIAARAGVTLAELRAVNPQLKDKGIFRNTPVNIPKKGKKPTPEYTGPVPFRPGSAAAKKYEAARKKK